MCICKTPSSIPVVGVQQIVPREDSHYLWILHLQFTYYLRLICSPQINTGGTCIVTQGCGQNSEKYESSDIHVPSQGQTRRHSSIAFVLTVIQESQTMWLFPKSIY